MSNLLILPGLGSVLAGRRVGYVQMGLAVAGLVGTLVAAVGILMGVWRERMLPPLDAPWWWWGAAGVALFMVGWLWALATSLSLLSEAEREEGSRPSSDEVPGNGLSGRILTPPPERGSSEPLQSAGDPE